MLQADIRTLFRMQKASCWSRHQTPASFSAAQNKSKKKTQLISTCNKSLNVFKDYFKKKEQKGPNAPIRTDTQLLSFLVDSGGVSEKPLETFSVNNTPFSCFCPRVGQLSLHHEPLPFSLCSLLFRFSNIHLWVTEASFFIISKSAHIGLLF